MDCTISAESRNGEQFAAAADAPGRDVEWIADRRAFEELAREIQVYCDFWAIAPAA